jgi:hypothetical protein
MTSLKTSLLTAFSLVVGTIGSAHAIGSRSLPAFSGTAQSSADFACLTNGNGNIANICDRPVQWCLGLPTDGTGLLANNTTVVLKTNVDAALTRGAPIACGSFSTTDTGTAWEQPPLVNSSIDPGWHTLSLPAVHVPTGGTVVTCCTLPPHANLGVVNWSW